MKLTCLKDMLMNQINTVMKAVSNRTTLPILECILLKAEKGGLSLMGNDLEMGIQTAPAEAQVEEEGAIAIEAKLFSDVIRKMEGENVFLSTDDKNIVTIRCGMSEYKIMAQSGEEFPEMPAVERGIGYAMKQKDLKNVIRQTIFSIAADESKPVLTGELLEIKENTFSFVSVDGYRISYKKAPLAEEAGAEAQSAIIPGKTLSELGKILLDTEEDTAVIYFTDKHVLFDLGFCVMVSRLIEGEFIKYDQSFTEDSKTKVTLSRGEFLSCLERASLLSRDVRKTPVKLEMKENKLVITSQTDMGASYEELAVELDGDDLLIAFNPRYFMEALRVIEDEKVSLQFNSPLSPCIIRPVESDDYKYLILPLRM